MASITRADNGNIPPAKASPVVRALRPKPKLTRSPRWFLRHHLARAAEGVREAVLPLRVSHVSGPAAVPAAPDEMIVACMVRDGGAYLEGFLDHYRQLGARHMVFLDNGSTDGTPERLAGEPDVTVLRSAASYKRNNVLAKRYLLRRFGRANWVLLVDVDELFDYPARVQVPLRTLLTYLNERGYTAVVAQMLDLFPSTPLRQGSGEAWRQAHRFYDISDIARQDYAEFFGGLNVIADPRVKNLWGGVRASRFGVRNHLTKHPLIYPAAGVRYLTAHSVTGARVADFSAVLLHYKYVGSFIGYMRRIAEEGSFFRGSSEYKSYVGALDADPDLKLYSEHSRELRSIDQLVREGFLVTSPALVAYASGQPL